MLNQDTKLFYGYYGPIISISKNEISFHFNSLKSIESLLDNSIDINQIIQVNDNISTEEIDTIKKNIFNGNYTFDNLKIAASSNNTKEVITLLKDKASTIDISDLDMIETNDIINSDNINDDIKFITKYNYYDKCTKSEWLELSRYLNNIVSYVKRYSLSPLEICIFVNDLLKEKKYNKSCEQSFDSFSEWYNNQSESRSLLKVYKCDNIVCVGFSNLYASILELCGINVENIFYYPTANNQKNVGHASNLVYLNDEKYSICGVYEVDTTWGRYTNEDGTYNYQKSINNYKYFCRSISNAIKMKELSKLNIEIFTTNKNSFSICYFENAIKLLYKYIEMGAPSIIIKNHLKIIIKQIEILNNKLNSNLLDKRINDLYNLINNINDGKYNIDELKNILDSVYKNIWFNDLSNEAFKKALYRVRLIEHSIDKAKYPIKEEELNKMVKERRNAIASSPEERLLYNILNEGTQFTEEQKLEIARSELISTLHKVAKDDKDQNPIKYK